MQNLTLPTSQTLALGNTLNSMDAIKIALTLINQVLNQIPLLR